MKKSNKILVRKRLLKVDLTLKKKTLKADAFSKSVSTNDKENMIMFTNNLLHR